MRSIEIKILSLFFCMLCTAFQSAIGQGSYENSLGLRGAKLDRHRNNLNVQQEQIFESSQTCQPQDKLECFSCNLSLCKHQIKNHSKGHGERSHAFCDQCFEAIFNSTIEPQLDEGDLDGALASVLNNIKTYQRLYDGLLDKMEVLEIDAQTLDNNHFAKNIADATGDSLNVLGSLAGLAGGIVLMTVPGGQVAAPYGIASGVAAASSLILKGSSSVVVNHLNKVESKKYEWLIIGTKSAETKVYGQLLSIDKWLAFQKLKEWDQNSEFVYTGVFGHPITPQFEDNAENTLAMIVSGVIKLSDAVFNWRSMKAAASNASEVVELGATASPAIAAAGAVADDAATAVIISQVATTADDVATAAASQVASVADEGVDVIASTTGAATEAANSSTATATSTSAASTTTSGTATSSTSAASTVATVSTYQRFLGGFGCIASIVGLVTSSRSLYRNGKAAIHRNASKEGNDLRNYSNIIAELKVPTFFLEKYNSIALRAAPETL